MPKQRNPSGNSRSSEAEKVHKFEVNPAEQAIVAEDPDEEDYEVDNYDDDDSDTDVKSKSPEKPRGLTRTNDKVVSSAETGKKAETRQLEEDSEDEEEGEPVNIDENQMLDIAEQIFEAIAQCLQHHNLTVRQTFGGDDMIHVLEEFEDEQNVEVMTADDFITRCYEIGVPELDQI